MNKVLFRICAWVTFISLWAGVSFCVLLSPLEMMDMHEVDHQSTLSVHFDHIGLLTSAVFYGIGFVLCVIVCSYIQRFFRGIYKTIHQPLYMLYEEPPGLRYMYVTVLVDNPRSPPSVPLFL